LRTLDTGAEWFVQLGHVSGMSRDGRRSYDRQPGFRVARDEELAASRPSSLT
jgi:hypothetical protein